MTFSRSREALTWALGESPDLAVAAARNGQVFFTNAAAGARWPDAAPGLHAELLFPEDARERFRAAAAAALGGASDRFEWGEQGRAGVRSWFSCTVSPLREGDEVNGYLCVSSETTELKRTEHRLRRSEQLMVDTQGTAHLGTWDWDISLPHATWSDELYRIYGLTPETYTPSYEAYLKMVHPDDRQRVADATNRVFNEHIPYSHDERIYRPDGSMRYLHTWAHPVLDEDGKLTSLVGVCQDITDQKLAEEQVRQILADLESRVAERTLALEGSMRELEGFNAMLSHDLRAPLSIIHLSVAVIRRKAVADPVPAFVTDNLDRIKRAVTHMTELVNDLLTLAQVGSAQITRTEIDLSALAEEILADLRSAEPSRSADTFVEPGLRCIGDAAMIRAALENLLGNAWKYSSRTDHTRIDVGRADHEGIFIRDNGAGFDMKQAHRLFTPFERLHNAAEFEGTGVGLAAVHRIVERHGGRIWADSKQGRGATFFLELPDAAPPSQRTPNEPSTLR